YAVLHRDVGRRVRPGGVLPCRRFPRRGIKLRRGIERLQELRYDRCRGLTLSRNRLRRRARDERPRYDGLTQQHPFHHCLPPPRHDERKKCDDREPLNEKPTALTEASLIPRAICNRHGPNS